MQIFSVQFSDGVALVNHIDCYDDTTGIFELSDGDIVTIEPQEPPVRLWTKCSRRVRDPRQRALLRRPPPRQGWQPCQSPQPRPQADRLQVDLSPRLGPSGPSHNFVFIE